MQHTQLMHAASLLVASGERTQPRYRTAYIGGHGKKLKKRGSRICSLAAARARSSPDLILPLLHSLLVDPVTQYNKQMMSNKDGVMLLDAVSFLPTEAVLEDGAEVLEHGASGVQHLRYLQRHLAGEVVDGEEDVLDVLSIPVDGRFVPVHLCGRAR